MESAEHQFLSSAFMSIVNTLSSSDLYSYRESGRKKFDFSCIVAENWDYSLDGQTLWKHSEGIDKDVRTLLVASDAQIAVYIARDTVKNRSIFFEAARDFKSSGFVSALNRLKVIWIPSDFDADLEAERTTVRDHLQMSVVDDLLFNVVFGRLTADRVRAVIIGSGMIGLETALLHHIGTDGFFNYPELRRRFEVSSSTLRDRVQRLQMSGFLLQPRDGGQIYHVSAAGRAYLRLCRQLDKLVLLGESIPDETGTVLRMLEIEPVNNIAENFRYSNDWFGGKTPEAMFHLMVGRVVAARYNWDVDWNQLSLRAHPDELDKARWLQF